MDVPHEPRAATPDRRAVPRRYERGQPSGRRHFWRERTPNCAAKSSRCWADTQRICFWIGLPLRPVRNLRTIRRARRSRLGHSSGHIASKASSARAAWARLYRARDTRLKRDVAVKVLPRTFARDADWCARFRREAELLATLNHAAYRGPLRPRRSRRPDGARAGTGRGTHAGGSSRRRAPSAR